MENVIINYSKAVYDNKISEFESYIKRLSAHLEMLEGYREKLRNFWDDSEADRYYNVLSEQIRAVRNAMNRTTELKTIYERTSADMAKQKTLTGGLIDEAEAALKMLGISES